MQMNRNAIKVLSSLIKYGCTTELKSFTIDKIVEVTKEINTYHSCRRYLKSLIENRFVNEGYKKEMKKTFFVTKEGLDKFKKLK